MHKDYSVLSLKEQESQIKKAIKIFQEANLEVFGFRCPYFRCNEDTLSVLNSANLRYESNETIIWNSIESPKIEDHNDSINRILRLYNPKYSEKCTSLPRIHNDLVSIPVSLPDDEILIDRLNW